jgi:hypothetical protein
VEFADDPLVAPARVLAGEAQHQIADLAPDRWPASPARIRPASRDQPAVPAKQRRRSDDERSPARLRDQPTGGGKEDAVGRPQVRPRDLAPQYRQLVAEHQDLELLDLHSLRARIAALPRKERWEALARRALWEDLQSEHRELTADILGDSENGAGAERVATWVTHTAPAVERCEQVLADVKTGERTGRAAGRSGRP